MENSTARRLRAGGPQSPNHNPCRPRALTRRSTSEMFGLSLCLLTLTLGRLEAGEPTAFDLVKEANRYVGEQAKDKVVQLRSEKSIGGLSPSIWYVVLYDPTASLKAVQVKFGGGKMLDVKRPMRLLEPVTGGNKPLDRAKLKVDSDRAIQTAVKEPVLDHVKVRAVAAKLERGELDLPVWKIRIWADRLKEPHKDVDLGEVHVGAEDGKVVKNDLHINRVD